MTRAMTRGSGALVAAAVLAGLLPGPAASQVVWDDLIFTGGVALEAYNGNFSVVTVPVVDSTDHASAAVGEFGARGRLRIPAANVGIGFDLGLRQFAARGFELRDYAPREWVGRMDAGWRTGLGSAGTLDLTAAARGRRVDDRPPMPLFLQPGYQSYSVDALYRTPVIQDVRFDLDVDREWTDYDAPELLPQLDLLDRRSWGVQAGAAFGPLAADSRTAGWSIRFHTGFRRSEFRNQGFDPTDPHRRDHTVDVGGTWTYDGRVYALLGVEGTVNRSNSDRPEYDALTGRGELFATLPWWDLGVNVLAVLTGKTYVHDVQFTLLVPGEEADNASIVYVDLNRPFTPSLDGAVRFGWTRAETDFGDAYYSRFGLTFQMNYRPPGI